MPRAAVREFARRAHRQPGDAAGARRRAGHLPFRLAGGRGRERLAVDVSRPISLRGVLGADGGEAHQQRADARRPDPDHGGQVRDRLVRADRRRRRVGLRRRAERLRADEGDDRRRRGRCALRGPARLGEEMRPHGRQSAGADPGSGAEADRGASRRRRHGRADRAPGQNRCGSGRHRHHRRRRERQALPHRRAHLRGLLQDEEGLRPGTLPGLAYAEYADMVWCETGTPDLAFAKKFAEGIRKRYPEKMLAYNCSPSFNWKRNLDDATIGKFQRELGAMGYKFQFITLAGFHSLNYSMFELAHGYARNNMTAFVELQQKEFAAAEKGFTAVKHQREVGTSYFDQVTQVVTAGKASTTALHGSTEDEQFFGEDALSQSKKAAKLAA